MSIRGSYRQVGLPKTPIYGTRPAGAVFLGTDVQLPGITINVELVVGQEVFEQHAEESRATAARKCKDPTSSSTPGLLTPCKTNCARLARTPPRAYIIKASLENVHVQSMPSGK